MKSRTAIWCAFRLALLQRRPLTVFAALGTRAACLRSQAASLPRSGRSGLVLESPPVFVSCGGAESVSVTQQRTCDVAVTVPRRGYAGAAHGLLLCAQPRWRAGFFRGEETGSRLSRTVGALDACQARKGRGVLCRVGDPSE